MGKYTMSTKIARIKNNFPRIGTSWRHKSSLHPEDNYQVYKILYYFVKAGKVHVYVAYNSRPLFNIPIDIFFCNYEKVED